MTSLKVSVPVPSKLSATHSQSPVIGIHVGTKAPVAIKLQRADHPSQKLPTEAKVYQNLISTKGFAKMHWFGEAHGHLALVLERLGPCLRSRQKALGRGGCLRRKEVRSVGVEVLNRLESMHDIGWLHLDVKPANFLLPFNCEKNKERCYPMIHLIDFGLSRQWHELESGSASPASRKRNPVGTVRFASVANQQGEPLGRKDDLESLAYSLVALYQGGLPWGNVQGQTKKERFGKMLKFKKLVSLDVLCRGLPRLATFMRTARMLHLDQRPDYDTLRDMLRTM